MNKTIIIGRLTRDLTIRKTDSGKDVVNFTVAVQKKFNRNEADFINCVAWEQTARFMDTYLKKGSLVAIEGRIESNNYKNNNDEIVYRQDVVVENLKSLEPISKHVIEEKEEEEPKELTPEEQALAIELYKRSLAKKDKSKVEQVMGDSLKNGEALPF